MLQRFSVVPAQAGAHRCPWIPASAGMTRRRPGAELSG